MLKVDNDRGQRLLQHGKLWATVMNNVSCGRRSRITFVAGDGKLWTTGDCERCKLRTSVNDNICCKRRKLWVTTVAGNG